MIKTLTKSLVLTMLATTAVYADDTQDLTDQTAPAAIEVTGDLILGPGIEEGQPFYKDGLFQIGDKKVRIEQAPLPSGKKVQYNAEWNLITVNSDPAISEEEKGLALVGLLDGLVLDQTIMPAAGTEDTTLDGEVIIETTE